MEKEKKPFFIKQNEFELLSEHCETPKGERIVIDGMAMTPQQILDRFAAGTEFKVAPVFSPDSEDLDQEDLGELRRMELYDLHARGEALQNQLDELEQQIKEKEKAELKAREVAEAARLAAEKKAAGEQSEPAASTVTT